MAIKRSEIQKRQAQYRQAAIKHAEARIDSALVARGVGATVDCGHLDAVTRDEIERIYREAGWKVTFFDDQRDGAFWKFE